MKAMERRKEATVSVLEADQAAASRSGGMTCLEQQVANRLRTFGADRQAAALARVACRSTEKLLRIARQVRLDPRWLLTGKSSVVGAAMLDRLRQTADGVALLSVRADAVSLASIAMALPQPPLSLGVCRYCGCHRGNCCGGGCRWVDQDETICSSCVEVPHGGD